ncbi:MFS transporter [Microbacterium sp. ARD32]|uniref:MFS transporter n=1 Tax=Microbacterium sp. ARD32 TaxID=2962577 RepID=UPI002881696E|nr:MFS transporter [Microbacterium sp. ARD32]MDT0157861.1 MFS transporter [Microbacterium sp. ARD32]
MALTFRQKALLSTPLPATWMSSVVIHNVYVKFYTDVIGLSPEYVGWVYLAFNIWNVLNDPVFGVILDKIRYRPGKGKFLRVMRVTVPFMLFGLVAMAWASPDWPQTTTFLVFLTQLFLFDIASTFYLISATSYIYLAAPSREDRIDVEVGKTWIGNACSAVATVVATQLLVGDAITEHTTMAVMLMGVVLVNAVIYVIPLVKLKDPPELYEKGDAGDEHASLRQLRSDAASILRMRSFWAWFCYGITATAPMGMYFTAFLYFMDHVIRSSGTEATITDMGSMIVVLVLLPLYARMIKRIGSRTSVYVGMLPYVVGLGALFLVTEWWQVLLCYVVLMSGRQIMMTAGAPLEAALIDENERLTGTRKTGSFTALRAILSAPLIGTQTALFLWLISAFGYDQNAQVQTEAAQFGIRFATAGVPIIFVLLGAVALAFLPYSRTVEADLSEYSRSRRSPEAPLAAPIVVVDGGRPVYDSDGASGSSGP